MASHSFIKHWGPRRYIRVVIIILFLLNLFLLLEGALRGRGNTPF